MKNNNDGSKETSNMQIWLNSYRPLVIKPDGWKAIKKYGFHPFLDSSCRREPDFEAEPPSITALCRGRNFAPHLQEGDIVIYLARKDRYPYLNDSPKETHWRFVALLEIINHFDTHCKAAEWYTSQGRKLPSNCIVDGNHPLSLDKTVPPRKYKTDLDRWDKFYQKRVSEHSDFFICKVIWMNLDHPPVMTNKIMIQIFGRIYGMQNPTKKITLVQLSKLKCAYGIE